MNPTVQGVVEFTRILRTKFEKQNVDDKIGEALAMWAKTRNVKQEELLVAALPEAMRKREEKKESYPKGEDNPKGEDKKKGKPSGGTKEGKS